ncbi:RICIN domain-containing protein [Streptomyces sp. RS10V-4]|uniref:RICIN domain-containing protein n=1 Tax=Streptomyces rhizoryzae TaxID=2932493 RepID=UPI002003310C|nr:RICIN domain-containing protein [Streptomyces rhizoryzae]MCK7626860.1 RICIN domain-containing protein [Streptomyces rhizoryzae]
MRRRNAVLAAAAAALLALAPLTGSAQAARPDAAAARMQEGRYLIVNENPEAGKLDFSPLTIPVYPPIFFIVGSHNKDLKEQWTVRPAGNGAFTINSTTHPDAAWSRRGDTIVASEGSRSQFAIEPAGEGTYRIHSPNEDAVATLNESGREQLHVEPANGAASQRWRFVRVGE